jgi:hypothetical protein
MDPYSVFIDLIHKTETANAWRSVVGHYADLAIPELEPVWTAFASMTLLACDAHVLPGWVRSYWVVNL